MAVELRPEEQPTYLGQANSTAQQVRREELRNIIHRDSEIAAMFGTPGWRYVQTDLENFERQTRLKIMSVKHGVKELDELYAQRERLSLIQWLLQLPQATNERLAEARSQLEAIEGDTT